MDYPNVPLAICGDLNCDLLKEPSFRASQHLNVFLSNYSLDQLVTTPTFTSGSLSDVRIINNREQVCSTRVNYCHFCPHKFIDVIVNLPKLRQKPTVISSRSFKRLDHPALYHYMLDVDWDYVFSTETASDKWDVFLALFVPVLNATAQIKRASICNPTAPPVSAATRDLMSQRRTAPRHLGRNSGEYKDLNRSVRAAVRRNRRVELRREIGERGPNKVWQ